MSKEILVERAEETEQTLLSTRFLEELSKGNPEEVVISWDKEGALGKILPEVVTLKGIEQREDYHLEGDVWVHTLRVLKFLPQNASLDLKLAALFHDIGKAETSETINGVIHFIDHSRKGAEITRSILDRFGISTLPFKLNKERIIWLVEYHLIGQGSGGDVLREATIKRYFLRPDGWGKDLLDLITADTLGREAVSKKPKMATLDATIAKIAEMKAKALREPTPPLPIPNGHEIMELSGLSPSPAVGQILKSLEKIHQELGFTSKEEGKEIAVSFWSLLGQEAKIKEIPQETLDLTTREIIKMFKERDLKLRLGPETIRVHISDEPDPIIRKEVAGEWRIYPFGKGQASVLQENQVRILFLGPPRSGKTSLVHSLAGYLEEFNRRFKLDLTIQEIDLDKSRKDLTHLIEGGAFSAWGRKSRWTKPLSVEAQRDFKLRPVNILLGDGPGGEPDEITQIIAQSANCAVLIAKGENDTIYKRRREAYQKFFSSKKIPIIGEFRSRPKGQRGETTGEPIKSELRSFIRGEFIGGQIVGLQFGEENKDPVIEDTAKALLFSILPWQCRNREGRIER